MNKKFYGTLLLGTLLLGSTIVSCKDYDDDIDNLQNQITQLATKADMQSEVSKLQSAVATAQAAAENKAAAAEQAAKDAAAKAQAAADAAAKAQGTADAAATVEALNKVAADAAAAAQAAADAKTAAEAKAAELEAQLAELQALAATLVSTKDFEAAKKELNDKYAELAAKIGETTGVTGMTGINLVGNKNAIAAGYGVWAGVRDNMQAAEWDGPKAKEINAIEKNTKLAAWGAKDFTFSVNPTDFDASKIEAFAIVNQFDEVAPIAFGAPKAVTRAAAGAWTLPVLGNAIYGEKAAEFEKNFSVDKNNANGTMATLVAGQFAGALADKFCTVKANENKDKSVFTTEVAYDKIDGVVELDVKNPEYVFDAYIVQLAAGMEGSVAHDSIVYKLAYTGTTLTYDAANVKKLVAKGNKTLKVTVKQINLNGYIHTTTEEITFKAKAAPENIKAETVLVDKVDHQVVINVLDKATGKKTDLQKQTADLSKALTEWGIDLSKKDAESTIHWMHTTDINDTKATVDTVYYYAADETKKFISGLIKEAKLKKDSNTGKLSVEFKFAEDYKYTSWDAKTNDAAWKGEKVYVELSFTGTDTDATVETKTDYKVIVPIQFNTIDATQYYNWNKNKYQSAPGKIEYTYTNGGVALAQFAQILNIRDQFEAVAGSGVTLTTADTTQVFGGTPSQFKYVQPALSLSGALSIKEYTDAKATILALEEGKTPATVIPAYTPINPANTGTTTINQVFKDKEIAELNKKYMNALSIQTVSSTNKRYVTRSRYNWNSNNSADTWNEILVCQDATYTSNDWMDQTYDDFEDYKTDKISLVLWNNNVPACLNAEYAVNGLKVSIAGREVNAPLSVKLSYNAPAANVPTFTTTAKLANTAGASILLSNSEFSPVTASNFNGTFTLKTADGKKLEIADDLVFGSTANIYTASLNADGSIPNTAFTGNAISAASVKYNYAANTYTRGLQFTMNTPVAPGAEKKIAVRLRIQKDKVYIAGTTTPLGTAQEDAIEFRFILELQ